MAATQLITTLLILARAEKPVRVDAIAAELHGTHSKAASKAAHAAIYRLRVAGWDIKRRPQGYRLSRDHKALVAMATTPHKPEWERVPGPCELLQVMENLLAKDPGDEMRKGL